MLTAVWIARSKVDDTFLSLLIRFSFAQLTLRWMPAYEQWSHRVHTLQKITKSQKMFRKSQRCKPTRNYYEKFGTSAVPLLTSERFYGHAVSLYFRGRAICSAVEAAKQDSLRARYVSVAISVFSLQYIASAFGNLNRTNRFRLFELAAIATSDHETRYFV